MKANFVKVIMIFLGLILATLMVIDCYTFIVAYKMSISPDNVVKVNTMFQYNVFKNIWILAVSMFVSIILIAILLRYVIKEFFRRRKTYYLKEVIEYNV
jgi:hypothetical protein